MGCLGPHAPMACSEFLHMASEEKAGKICNFIQIRDIQIVYNRGCQYNFREILETSLKKF